MKEARLGALLRRHARTFALTLALMPRPLRESLGLAYLLARASDTVADCGSLPPERRIAWLESLAACGSIGEAASGRPGFSPAERELLDSLPELLALLEQSIDRTEIRALWREILEGQLYDLSRFVPGCTLLDRGELEHYCDLVAGSVGRSWTRLIARHAPGGLKRPVEDLQPLATDYGRGLQLVNILRDRRHDRAMGRLYVVEEQVPEVCDLAGTWLRAGDAYCAALRPGRILAASSLPLELAWSTLRLIRETRDSTACLTRWDVRRTLLGTLPSLVLPRCPDRV